MADVLVLSYHAVSPGWPSHLAVHPDAFREQVRLLARRGYAGSTVSRAVHDPPAGPTVAFTFDDAYASVREHALPILADAGYPGTIFVPTDFPGRPGPMVWPGIDQWEHGPHAAELTCLTWDELRELSAAGWEIGPHGKSHPHMPELDDEMLREELEGARRRCEEELGAPCRSLAYPYGEHDDRVVEAVRRAGITTACTVPDELGCTDPLRWPRIGVYRTDSSAAFRAKVSPSIRALRRTAIGSSALPALRGLSQRVRDLRRSV